MIRPHKRFHLRQKDQRPRYLSASCFEKEPTASLCLINPVLKKTGSGHVACIIAERVYRAHAQDQALLVFVKLTQHVFRCYVLCVIIRNTLQASDMPNRANSRSADLADTFSNVVGHGKDLVSVIIE